MHSRAFSFQHSTIRVRIFPLKEWIAGALVYWLWEETHAPKGCELESSHCILDGYFLLVFVVKIIMTFV